MGLRPQGARGKPAEPRLGLLRRKYGDLHRRRRALDRRYARRHDPHDTADHPFERHPLYRRQRQGEPHPEQPVLHPADDRQRGKRQLQKIFHPRRAAAAFHARAPARRQCGGEPGRAQRHGLHHGEHVGRAFGLSDAGGLCRPGNQGLHAVPRLADARRPLFQTHVCQRHALDTGHALGAGKHPFVPDAVRTDAAIAR